MSANSIDEIKVNVVALFVYNAVFDIPYIYTRDAIFVRRENYNYLIKYGKYVIIDAHKGKFKISLVCMHLSST